MEIGVVEKSKRISKVLTLVSTRYQLPTCRFLVKRENAVRISVLLQLVAE
jgi:hypothetical protein